MRKKKQTEFKKNDVVMLVNLDENHTRRYWFNTVPHLHCQVGLVTQNPIIPDTVRVQHIDHEGFVSSCGFFEHTSELVKIGEL